MTESVPLGTVVYTAVKPFFKIYAILGCGFYLGRKDIISPFFTKMLSDVVISVLFPCLVFEKIVSELESDNIREIGIIALVSVLYFGMGGLGGLLSYYAGGSPKYWKGGSISVGILPNISDLPIAYLTTFAGGLVFDDDQGQKGIAYICIFTLFQIMVQFNFGVFKLIGYDYHQQMRDEKDDLSLEELKESEQDDDDDDEEAAATRPDLITVTQPSQMSLDTLDSNSAENPPISASLAPQSYVTRERAPSISTTGTGGTAPSIVSSSSLAGSTTQITRKHTNVSQMSQLSRQQSILSNMLGDSNTHNTHQIVKTFSHQVVNSENLPIQFDSISIKPKPQPVPSSSNTAKQSNTSILHTLKSFLFFMLDNLKKPISLALLVAITIAMIPWVRAIFVQSNQVKIHPAPDNQPPLSFVIDFATYLGNASVPCGLLLLGATLSRLNIGEMPRFFWITPLLLSIMRLILMPIVGCLICWGLKKAHWFEGDDMLLFVCLIVWGVPNATSIIYISAYYAPIEKELQAKYKQLNYLSLCYAIQYTVLIVSLPFLCVFSVKVILEY